MLEKNPIERMYIAQMIEDIPPDAAYDLYRLSNTEDLLQKLNKLLTTAPEFNDTLLVGTPFSAIILWAMGNPTGVAAFRRKKINNMFKKILKEWSKFLDGPKSRYVLNHGPNGWFSKKSLKKIHMSDFQHNKNAKYFGFKSWNDFLLENWLKGRVLFMNQIMIKLLFQDLIALFIKFLIMLRKSVIFGLRLSRIL